MPKRADDMIAIHGTSTDDTVACGMMTIAGRVIGTDLTIAEMTLAHTAIRTGHITTVLTLMTIRGGDIFLIANKMDEGGDGDD